MARVLPSSLSPLICLLQSPDLSNLFNVSSLPPLHDILQSFSPLPQVTTRTTSLTSVPHASFALRFSDLIELEEACREGEEQRAVRTIDWIGARISHRCSKWVEDMELSANSSISKSPPWWDELKQCAESDHVPSRIECWNHPVAIILAVSTAAPNPLQAIAALHSRPLQLPTWVDPAILRYTLIVHPKNSPLTDEEAGALFNAVKKQYGLHSHFLSLVLPSPPPNPVSVPPLPPRLPPQHLSDVPDVPFKTPVTPDFTPEVKEKLLPTPINTLSMGEQDIQSTARFAREFVVMSLVPWMEKCVLEWNENFSSTRRLPSRLFSSTRRLFGSPSPSPAPTHSVTSSISSLPTRSGTYDGSQSGVLSGPHPLPQQRRLAEFATILGDLKLAVTVWESLRKEGKGGSDILPILLAPSPTLPLHAFNALSSIHPPTPDLPAHAQLRALIYAIRWEVGLGSADFLGSVLEGERWLVWAAGNAEEPPSALLLAHAALLSARKQARRRAALWYFSAANRLEKCGIKPLTMYFLRRAHELYKVRLPQTLSPSFWESEDRSPDDTEGLDVIMSGIEHPLGRLLYTTGEVAGAVRFFLGLLRGSKATQSSVALPNGVNGGLNEESKIFGADKVFLDDFRVAFAHYKSTAGDDNQLDDLKLPFTLCLNRQTRLRLPRNSNDGVTDVWQMREESWKAFWRNRGKEGLAQSGKAAVGETFWVDLVLRNPLDAEINVANLTVGVEDSHSRDPGSSRAFVEVEVIDDVVLAPKETRTIPVSIKSLRPSLLTIADMTYDFLSLLPASESLSSRGRRLHETALQRQSATYGADVVVKVEVAEASHRLLVDFVDDGRLVLAQGETKRMRLWFSNAGSRDIGEVWMVAGPEDEVWVDLGDGSEILGASPASEVLHSTNSIAPRRPFRMPLKGSDGLARLSPGDSTEFSLVVHADHLGEQELCLLFAYREENGGVFHSARVSRHYEVKPILDVTVNAQPSRSLDHLFVLNVELENVSASTAVQITQLTTLSPTWNCSPIAPQDLDSILPSQMARFVLGATKWDNCADSRETVDFVSRKLRDVLYGNTVDSSDPPPLDLLCSHISRKANVRSVQEAATRHFIHSRRRNIVSRSIARSHPYIPVLSHSSIFPLYNPSSVDVIVFWEIPAQARSGHLLVSGVTLGAGHAALRDIIEEAESAKVKRSMYAETQRERSEVLEAVRQSEWNAEMDPTVLTLQDGGILQHDFSQGPCKFPLAFTLRNYSLTHTSRFVLKFTPDSTAYPPSSSILPPPYIGRLTFRGTLRPTEQAVVNSKIWITRPGTYGLGGWHLETEVGETPPPTSPDLWQTRHRYEQEPPLGDRSCVTVCDLSGS